MRLPSIHEPEESNSMSAMTDVVFLLLIFFIVTMSGYVEMTLLETNLPTASGKISDKVDLQESLTIELSSDGQTIINGIQQTPESLNRLFSRYSRLMPKAEFLLQCDPESRHNALVSLLSALAKHNLKNVKLLKITPCASFLTKNPFKL